ncbi:Phospholipase A2 crotoxin acid subunit CA [Datura stramonium]|uniref:Carbonic anhydrase n=1 Tax=Datura stramonium TaxID=4076 RepID=A0ABS8SGW6_DATST|nr:Phospholipase A2 crotoxin acid subunit CA [Datura stramonium]
MANKSYEEAIVALQNLLSEKENWDRLQQKELNKSQLSCNQAAKPSTLSENQPGEAFMVRNIANMVPPYDKLRYSGVGAVIEYAVLHLKVENILVGWVTVPVEVFRLAKLPEDGSESTEFIENWMKIGLPAKAKVVAKYPDKSFEEQCKYCEKEAAECITSQLGVVPICEMAW